MARPRNTLFFETPLPQPLPESMRWLQEYDQASKKLIDYLVEHGAGSTAYHVAVRCLTDLRDYLVENELSFSLQDANKWLYEILDSFPKGGLLKIPVTDFTTLVFYHHFLLLFSISR